MLEYTFEIAEEFGKAVLAEVGCLLQCLVLLLCGFTLVNIELQIYVGPTFIVLHDSNGVMCIVRLVV